MKVYDLAVSLNTSYEFKLAKLLVFHYRQFLCVWFCTYSIPMRWILTSFLVWRETLLSLVSTEVIFLLLFHTGFQVVPNKNEIKRYYTSMQCVSNLVLWNLFWLYLDLSCWVLFWLYFINLYLILISLSSHFLPYKSHLLLSFLVL